MKESSIVFLTSQVFRLNGREGSGLHQNMLTKRHIFFKTAPKLVEKIIRAGSAHKAFKTATANADKAPEDWEEKKVRIMESIVRAKLKQNPYVMHKLLQTGKRLIVEDSPKDGCWGWGKDKKGRNELGKIWMRLRDEITKA